MRRWPPRRGMPRSNLLRQSHPDLVLVDVQLPGMSGYQVTRQIKADPALADIPVVALTAHAMARRGGPGAEGGLRRLPDETYRHPGVHGDTPAVSVKRATSANEKGDTPCRNES